jgi:predicted XRE-type DNA-binding protein
LFNEESDRRIAKVSDMMRGCLTKLSERKLKDCLTRLGDDIENQNPAQSRPKSGI